MIDEEVGLGGGEALGGETEPAAAGGDVGVPGRLNIHGTIADHQSGDGGNAGLFHEAVDADGMGLLLIEGVAAVDFEEVVFEAESGDNALRDADGLVGEDRHLDALLAEQGDGFFRAWVEAGFVETMLVVITNEVVEGSRDLFVRSGFAHHPADKHGGAVADVGGDESGVEGIAIEERAGRVDGIDEISFRVDQGAVEIKDNEVEKGHYVSL